MNAKRLLWAALAALSLGSALPGVAVAADGLYYPYGGYYTPWPYLFTSIYALESAPYYALHPPVYYSFPVPRPYGCLPYPYLPGLCAQGGQGCRQAATTRVYAAGQSGPTVATGAEVIVNPHWAAKDAAQSSAEGSLPPRVHVTYPAKMFAQSE